MATREENLKKINEELEKLDDEQLEEIAGGGYINILYANDTNQEDQNQNQNQNPNLGRSGRSGRRLLNYL